MKVFLSDGYDVGINTDLHKYDRRVLIKMEVKYG